MRKCIRCGCEMKENCAVKIEGAGYGIVLSSDENKLFGGRIGKPKAAICPECGEVSIYLEDLDVRNMNVYDLKDIFMFINCSRGNLWDVL